MSDFLAQLYAAPSRGHGAADTTDNDYDRQLRDLLAYLKRPGLVPSTADVNELLEAVNPAIHSLSFLFLLRFQIHHIQKRTNRDIPDDLLPGYNLWKHAVRFLRLFDPIQIRYAGHEWRRLVELIASAAQSVSNPVLAVKVIRDALERFETSGTFTSMHQMFVKLALHSSSYAYALPIMDKFLYQFPADSEHARAEHPLCSVQASDEVFITDTSGFSKDLTYRDHLQFYLYSAMIYMAVKQWDRASHCLNIVISSPTANSVSKIMVEAYKKWMLVNLLGHGKLPPTSSLIAPHVMRVYQSLARPYISLAEAFEKGDMRKLAAEINIGRAIWRADNNSGLVSLIFEAYDKFVVIKLGVIFSALTMPDVLQRASPCSKVSHDIEEFVVSLVMSNELKATLSHSSSSENTTMLRFAPTTRTCGLREEYIRARLIQTKHALSTIARGVIQTDRTLRISSENLQFIVNNQTWNGNSEKSGVVGSCEADGGDVGDIDEDLMGNAY